MQTKTYVMLTADEGMILTNGEVYGKVIALGNGNEPENYREIPQADYDAFLAEQAKSAPIMAEEPEETEETEETEESEEIGETEETEGETWN